LADDAYIDGGDELQTLVPDELQALVSVRRRDKSGASTMLTDAPAA
jgi:hypothetical protein